MKNDVDVDRTAARSETSGSRRRFFGLRRGSARSQVFVCRLTEDGLRGVHLRRSGGGLAADGVIATGETTRADLGAILSERCPVVLMLPRSQYLIKVLEVPKALPGEVPALLRLQAEAALPGEFGKAEVSCRRLPALREGHDRYEVYVSRGDLIAGHLASLAALGLRVDLALPSAVVWAEVFDSQVKADMFVASPSDDMQLELASRGPDGTLSLRTIERDASGGESPLLMRGLVECIRSLLVHREPESILTIGWLGEACPASGAHDQVAFIDAGETLFGPNGVKPRLRTHDPLMLLLGISLLEPEKAPRLETGNLLPRSMVLRRRQHAMYRRTAAAAALVLLAIAFLYVALAARVSRNRSLSDDITARTAAIRKEGESVGNRLEQLRAISTARATRNDFRDVLQTLYDATPAGITYNTIGLTADGRVQLRGQADSLSLPFLLPEQLEKHQAFQHVLLHDAGQVKRQGGTMTEFRIECSLDRSGRK